ncbi:hypothetical protein E2C01_009737 [Portunus trituberculatus]|uniref:Uncharacterized protein n=1 Tax=Portunus trituberculatus TaxID=210409 RepID=A0A5B7D6J1_PORTR|nr:hypothetical protein [Portunus trituberculatus]
MVEVEEAVVAVVPSHRSTPLGVAYMYLWCKSSSSERHLMTTQREDGIHIFKEHLAYLCPVQQFMKPEGVAEEAEEAQWLVVMSSNAHRGRLSTSPISVTGSSSKV